jgi:hypothetical protein
MDVKHAYKKIFLSKDGFSLINEIVKKTWNNKNVPEILKAYTIVIVNSLLNPKILSIEISQATIKTSLAKYLVISLLYHSEFII